MPEVLRTSSSTHRGNIFAFPSRQISSRAPQRNWGGSGVSDWQLGSLVSHPVSRAQSLPSTALLAHQVLCFSAAAALTHVGLC